jgi:hypothetical protein
MSTQFVRIQSASTSSKRRSAGRRPPRWGSARKPPWRSSSATLAGSSPVSADGPGATAANCRACGWSRVCGARPGYAAYRRRRSRGGSTRVLADRPLHLRLPGRALYERNGYELVGRVEDFPSGTDVLWYRKRLSPPKSPAIRERSRSEKPGENTAALMTDSGPEAGTPSSSGRHTPAGHPSPADSARSPLPVRDTEPLLCAATTRCRGSPSTRPR